MQADVVRGSRHQVREAGAAKRRHWIFAFPRAFEDVPTFVQCSVDIAGLTGNSDLSLDPLIVRFEFFITERPVLDGRSLRNSRGAVPAFGFADDFEVPGIEPPALTPIMDGGAANRIHHGMPFRAWGHRRRCGRAVRRDFIVDFLQLCRPAPHIPQFIGSHIARAHPASRFQGDDLDSCLCQRKRSHATSGSHADDHDVCLFKIDGHNLLH